MQHKRRMFQIWSGTCVGRSLCGVDINMIAQHPRRTALEKGKFPGFTLNLRQLERRLPPFAQRTLVRLAHPLDVRDAAHVACRNEAMVQHLDVRERQQWRYVVVLYIQCSRETHKWAAASDKRHARRAHVVR